MSKQKTIKELQEFCKDKRIISKLNLMITTLEQIVIEFESDDFQTGSISLRANSLKKLTERLKDKINEIVIEQEKKINLFNALFTRLQEAGYNVKLRNDSLQLEVYSSDISNAWAICIVHTRIWANPKEVEVSKMFGSIEKPFVSSDEDELFNHIIQLCNEYVARQNLIECKTS